MSQNLDADFLGELQLDYDAWRERLQKICGRYNPEGIERNAFTGWIRPIEVCGFKALETGCNAGRIARDYHDVRLDYADHYFVLFPLSGQSLVTQNEQATRLGAGDVVLVDTTRPVKLFSQNNWNDLGVTWPSTCRGGSWWLTLASNLRVDVCAPMEPRQAGCYSSSLKARTKSLHQNHRRPIPICSLWCTIWSALYLRRPISPAVRGMQINCSRASGALSSRAVPIQTSVLPRWRPGQEFRYAICRSCSRSAVQPAVN